MSDEAKKKEDLDNEQQAADSDSELAKLREQSKIREQEAKDNYDRFVRQVAELENFRKRTTREKEEAIRYANESLIRDLLPVIDNLERAISHAKGGGNGQPLVEGVALVLKGLSDVLNKHGVEQVAAAGRRFDPARHEAMAQVQSDVHEPNTVIEEHHKGYMLKDRLLRPALVTVAASAATEPKKNADTEVENDPVDD
jgi:molecular chaperone GrpE